jgi:hypothetical protein
VFVDDVVALSHHRRLQHMLLTAAKLPNSACRVKATKTRPLELLEQVAQSQ